MVKNLENLFLLNVISLLSLTICAGCQTQPQSDITTSQGLRIINKTEGFMVMEGKDKVLFYRSQPAVFSDKVSATKDTQTNRTLAELLRTFDEDSRPHYIHPLYGLDGEVLTEDFPLDHPHHHGIFWAWHQVLVGNKNMGDAWLVDDFVWDVQKVEILEQGLQRLAFKTDVFWKSPRYTDSLGRQKPFVRETTTICIHKAVDDIRKIDFELNLSALTDDVRIGGADNEKAYSGFSARFKFPKSGLVFTGRDGNVKPANTPVEAGPWMDFSGDFCGDGRLSGLAILCHKSNPGYPTPWILRRRESMQNAVYPGREPVKLSTEAPLVLRYRLIIHRGDAQQLDLDKLQTEYNAE